LFAGHQSLPGKFMTTIDRHRVLPYGSVYAPMNTIFCIVIGSSPNEIFT
jgi:hypothetical protein